MHLPRPRRLVFGGLERAAREGEQFVDEGLCSETGLTAWAGAGKVKDALVVEGVPRWGKSNSPGYRRQQLRQAVEVHHCCGEPEEVSVADAKLGLVSVGVPYSHHAQTKLG